MGGFRPRLERFSVKTTKTELLFLELMYDLLVTGGRCGVIVPEGSALRYEQRARGNTQAVS